MLEGTSEQMLASRTSVVDTFTVDKGDGRIIYQGCWNYGVAPVKREDV